MIQHAQYVGTLRNLEKWCLFFMILAFPIMSMPKRFVIPFASGQLYFAFLFLALLFFCIESGLSRKFDVPFWKWAVIWCGWIVICICAGLIIYPYPIDSSIFTGVRSWEILSSYFPILQDSTSGMKTYLFVTLLGRAFKGEILPFLGIFTLVIHLYKNQFRQGLLDIRRAALILAVLMSVYSVPEIIWIATDNSFCKDILIQLNPYLFDPGLSNGWWPPLLWYRALRSLCPEPSFFGILAIFILPFLWLWILERWYIGKFLFLVYFTSMVFMTGSRTAMVIYLGEVVLLCILAIWHRFPSWKNMLGIICSCTLIAFFIGAMVIPYAQRYFDINKHVTTTTTQFVEQNITSVTKSKGRSNNARYGTTVAAIRIGMDHPITGVGRGMEKTLHD